MKQSFDLCFHRIDNNFETKSRDRFVNSNNEQQTFEIDRFYLDEGACEDNWSIISSKRRDHAIQHHMDA